MTYDEFDQQAQRLEANFKGGKKYSIDAKEIMWGRLKLFPVEAMKRATENMIAEEKYLPHYNEIHGALRRVMAGSSHLKMIEDLRGRAKRIKCGYCEDTGIRLRKFRKDVAKDFYCACAAANELKGKVEWDTPEWRQVLMTPAPQRLKAFRDECTRQNIGGLSVKATKPLPTLEELVHKLNSLESKAGTQAKTKMAPRPNMADAADYDF